jgi:DNA-binding PadR family transcriptional regulator
MERNGWLRCAVAAKGGVHARKSYYLTDKGRDVLEIVLAQLEELRVEVGRKKRRT